MITLVLGGARSGKSRFGEAQADHWRKNNPAGERLYIATAEIHDDEMRRRVDDHKSRRGADWHTLEEPLDLPRLLQTEMRRDRFVLIDCLTLWLSNLLLRNMDGESAVTALCRTLRDAKGEAVLVSNEVGLGIVPENALARRFRDLQGLANQHIAETADKVVLVAAGLPLVLKGG